MFIEAECFRFGFFSREKKNREKMRPFRGKIITLSNFIRTSMFDSHIGES